MPLLFLPSNPDRRFLVAAAIGGIVAGMFSTLVQIILWLLFTNAFPAILWRDARLAAAVLLGPRALPPPAAIDWPIMASATLLHFGLSLVYGIAFCTIARGLGWRWSAATGVLLGMALYGVNLYGFTWFFPWFAQTRDWITLAAHMAFGVSAVTACRFILGHSPERNRKIAPMSQK